MDKDILVFIIFIFFSINAFFYPSEPVMKNKNNTINSDKALIFEVKVVPQSGTQKISWDRSYNILKVHLKSAPEKNMANSELCSLLAKQLKLSRNNISLVGGQASRRKMLKIITNLSEQELYIQLGVASQMDIQESLFT